MTVSDGKRIIYPVFRKRAKPAWIAVVLFLVFYFSLPRTAHANIQEIFGLSPKATGMGNAFSAVADDFSACYYNPGGLGQHDHHQLVFGYVFCQPSLKQYHLLGSDEVLNAQEDTNFRSFLLGAVLDLTPIVDLRGRNFVLGAAAAVGDNFKAGFRFHEWPLDVPRFFRYGDGMYRLHLYVGLGLEVFKDIFYVGASINFTQDIGIPRFDITIDLQQNVLQQDVDGDVDAEISPIVGVLLKPFPWLSLAYTYRDQASMNVPLTLTATVRQGKISIPIKAYLPLRDFYLPWNMTVGLSVKPIASLLLAVDMTYYHWSSFLLPMREGTYPEFDNTLLPRVGVEYRLWDSLSVRAGYYYEPSPVPDQSNIRSNLLDFDKNVFSFGLGYAFQKLPVVGPLPFRYPIALDGFFQYQWLADRTQLKNTGQPDWRIGGNQFALGISITLGL